MTIAVANAAARRAAAQSLVRSSLRERVGAMRNMAHDQVRLRYIGLAACSCGV